MLRVSLHLVTTGRTEFLHITNDDLLPLFEDYSRSIANGSLCIQPHVRYAWLRLAQGQGVPAVRRETAEQPVQSQPEAACAAAKLAARCSTRASPLRQARPPLSPRPVRDAARGTHCRAARCAHRRDERARRSRTEPRLTPPTTHDVEPAGSTHPLDARGATQRYIRTCACVCVRVRARV